MAVSITKMFFHTKTARAWVDLGKIVFTSPNMDSDPTDPQDAGRRSHILPGSHYIGTWYEAVDYMYRIRADQSYPTNERECYFAEIFQRNPDFTFGVNTTFSGLCRYNPEAYQGSILCYDRDNYGYVGSVSSLGNVYIDGETFHKYNFTVVSGVGDTTLSGSWVTTTGSGVDRVYNWDKDITNTSWANAENSIVFEVTNGEAYNCRLTAWDDDSHNSTDNPVLDDLHYRVVAFAYRAGNVQAGGTLGNTEQSPGDQKELPSSANIPTSMAHPPGINLALKGNISYYGDFDLIHRPVEYTEHGEYLVFSPYLYGMDDSFTAGNYDFVTTLHYQYT